MIMICNNRYYPKIIAHSVRVTHLTNEKDKTFAVRQDLK